MKRTVTGERGPFVIWERSTGTARTGARTMGTSQATTSRLAGFCLTRKESVPVARLTSRARHASETLKFTSAVARGLDRSIGNGPEPSGPLLRFSAETPP